MRCRPASRLSAAGALGPSDLPALSSVVLATRLMLAVAGLVGAATERLSSRMDDSSTTPVAGAAAVTVAGAG